MAKTMPAGKPAENKTGRSKDRPVRENY